MEQQPTNKQTSRLMIALFITVLLSLVGVLYFTFAAQSSSHETDDHHRAATCDQAGETIVVRMTHDSFQPATISANRCDVIEFVNESSAIYRPALGEHDNHADYPGFEDATVDPGKSVRITLSQTGTYELHEHLDDRLSGTLTVD